MVPIYLAAQPAIRKTAIALNQETMTISLLDKVLPGRAGEYYPRRAKQGNLHAEFQCDPHCTRPGCKRMDLQVPVSLFDILGAAQYLGKSVSRLYREAYSLGLFSSHQHEWVWLVALRLKKPCPFLTDDRCRIYPVRPLPCMLFPENLVVRGTFVDHARQTKFKDYLCLQHRPPISRERRVVLRRLQRMWWRESLVSGFHLFRYTPFYVDLSNLRDELLQVAQDADQGHTGAPDEPGHLIPFEALEKVFHQRAVRCEPLTNVAEIIRALDHPQEQDGLFQLLENREFIDALARQSADRVPVFRYEEGELKAKRQRLSPLEYKFL